MTLGIEKGRSRPALYSSAGRNSELTALQARPRCLGCVAVPFLIKEEDDRIRRFKRGLMFLELCQIRSVEVSSRLVVVFF